MLGMGEGRRRVVSRGHRERRDLRYRSLAQTIDHMGVRELESVAAELLTRFARLSEAPGVRIQPDLVHSSGPSSTAPRSSPMCPCGCPSRRDHWQRQLHRALDRDMEQGGEPQRLRGAVLRCAVALEEATTTGRRPTLMEAESSDERDQRIGDDYEGLAPWIAAELESARPPRHWVSPEAIRRARRRLGLHPETGLPVGARDDQAIRARALRAEGKSWRDVGAELGVSHTTAQRWASEQQINERATA